MIRSMDPFLVTDRLTLRQFTLNDTPFILDLVNSPAWIEYIGDRNIKTEMQARSYLLNVPLRSYEMNGYGLSLVELNTDSTPIGMCGLICRENLPDPDIGFAFLPAFTGQGYAFEIVNATLAYAKDVLKVPVILAITMSENAPSINLLGKLGMRFKSTYISPGDKQELLLFST